MPNIFRRATKRFRGVTRVRFRKDNSPTQAEEPTVTQINNTREPSTDASIRVPTQGKDMGSSGLTSLNTSTIQSEPVLGKFLKDPNAPWSAGSKSKLTLVSPSDSTQNTSSEIDSRHRPNSSSHSGWQQSSVMQQRQSKASSPADTSSRHGRQSPILKSPIVARDMQNPSRSPSFITASEQNASTSVKLPISQSIPDLVNSPSDLVAEHSELSGMYSAEFEDPGPSSSTPDHSSSTTASSYKGPGRTLSDLTFWT